MQKSWRLPPPKRVLDPPLLIFASGLKLPGIFGSNTLIESSFGYKLLQVFFVYIYLMGMWETSNNHHIGHHIVGDIPVIHCIQVCFASFLVHFFGTRLSNQIITFNITLNITFNKITSKTTCNDEYHCIYEQITTSNKRYFIGGCRFGYTLYEWNSMYTLFSPWCIVRNLL